MMEAMAMASKAPKRSVSISRSRPGEARVPFGDSVLIVCPPILLTRAVQQDSFGERTAFGSFPWRAGGSAILSQGDAGSPALCCAALLRIV